MKLDWNKISNEEQFTSLVNYLLREKFGWTEISVARGKDKARDAKYNGNYKNKKGEWIFQYKWFSPEVGKRTNLSNLKAKIFTGKKPEASFVRDTYNPDNYILVTNLRLTGPNKSLFKELARKNGIKFFEVWDVAELEVLIAQYPSAQRKFFEGRPASIENYRSRFKDELENEESIFYCGANSNFLSRSDDIDKLVKFVTDPDSLALILSGRGGVGKTRLTIEFSKLVEEKLSNDFLVYFVRNSAELTINELLAELPRKDITKRTIILVFDDIHTYPNSFVSELDYLSRNENHSLKIVLVTRSELTKTVVDSLPLTSKFSNFDELELDNIDISSISKIVNARINNRDLARDIVRWARKGKWTPLETILVLSESEKSSASFKEVISESDIINRVFSRYISSYGEDTIKLLNLVSFIQPFNYQDEKVKEAIKQFYSWNDLQLNESLDSLKAEKDLPIVEFSEAYPILRIRPDILGDWLRDRASYRGEKVTEFVKQVINNFVSLLPESVIESVVQTEYLKKNKILDEVVEEIGKELSQGNNNIRINILKIIDKFAWYRPEDTLGLINIILNSPKDDYSIQKFESLKITHDHVKREIPEILEQVAVNISFFQESIILLFKIASDEQKYSAGKAEEALINLSKIVYRRSLKYNHILVSLIEGELSEATEKKKQLFIKLLKEQFKLSVNYSYLDPEDPRKFNWTEYPVKAVFRDIDSLVELREKSLNLLLSIINDSTQETKLEALNLLSSIVYGLNKQYSAFGRTKLEGENKYSQRSEYEKIFKFSKNLVSIELKKNSPDFAVINELSANTLKGLKEGLKNKTAEIQKILGSIKKSDKYLFYELLIAEHRDWDKQQDDLEKVLQHGYSKRIIDSYSKEPLNFALFLSSMLNLRKGWIFGSVKGLFAKLGEYNPIFAEELFKAILNDENVKVLFTYFGYILLGIRRTNKEKANELIKFALEKKSAQASQAVADSFDHYWVTKRDVVENEINIQNLDWLFEALKYADGNGLVSLASASNTFLKLSKTKGLKFLVSLSKKIDKDSLGLVSEISKALDPRDVSYEKNDISTLEEILDSFVDVYDLDKGQMTIYYLEQVFEVIVKYDVVYIGKFFEKRLEKKIELGGSSEYDAIPYGFKLPKLDNLEKELELFNQLKLWVLRKDWFAVEAPHFVSKLGFSPDTIQRGLIGWIDGKFEDQEKELEYLVAAAYMLRNFEDQDWVYDLVAKILVKAGKFESQEEKFRDIMSEVWAFIHTGGGWGDTKHRKVIEQINRILIEYGNAFSIQVKKRLREEIEYQEKEISRMNELVNGDWE